MKTRFIAAEILANIFSGASLSDALPMKLMKVNDARDQAFIQALCYGVCRWYFRLSAILKILMPKALKAKDHDVNALLLIGLYQLIDMRVPEHAAVAETVQAAQECKKSWAKNLINAVLRNYLRRREEIEQALQNNYSARFAHPIWLMDQIKKEWPETWQAILTANNEHPPFVLRVNQRNITREAYLKKLAEHSLQATPLLETSAGIMLAQPVEVTELPGFLQGDVSVQDGAAQLAASLLQLAPKQRVLDACAAPGGKTTHIFELQPDLQELVAIDISEERLNAVQDNLTRLQMRATLKVADAGDTSSWWDKKCFDRILLDAPCSATGVIRRHPDIKLLRQPDDIKKLAAEQRRILNALWPLLQPDGLLVYTTCSILAEENTQTLQAFLAAHEEAEEVKITATWGRECLIGRQILPGMAEGMDGFYFAVLRKKA